MARLRQLAQRIVHPLGLQQEFSVRESRVAVLLGITQRHERCGSRQPSRNTETVSRFRTPCMLGPLKLHAETEPVHAAVVKGGVGVAGQEVAWDCEIPGEGFIPAVPVFNVQLLQYLLHHEEPKTRLGMQHTARDEVIEAREQCIQEYSSHMAPRRLAA